jgi:hypothetical protein
LTRVLDERFEIRRRLGAGGMGEVFEAIDRDRGEVVALKTLRHPDPAALYNFKKEFRFLQDVSHPNLVSLYELVVDGGQWFFTMELVDGEGLKDYVYPLDQTLPIVAGMEPRAEPALCVERLRSALGQLAAGVKAVHDAGRLHRDLRSLDKRLVGELLPRRVDALARLFPVLMRVEAVAAGVEARSQTGRQTLELDNPDRPHLRRQALQALRQLLENLVTLREPWGRGGGRRSWLRPSSARPRAAPSSSSNSRATPPPAAPG